VQLARSDTAVPGSALNTVRGRVSAMEYQGSWLKITIEDACGEDFVVNESDSVFFANPVSVGDSVSASWKPHEVHFLTSGEQKVAQMSAADLARASIGAH
jgi:hypothetical protein